MRHRTPAAALIVLALLSATCSGGTAEPTTSTAATTTSEAPQPGSSTTQAPVATMASTTTTTSPVPPLVIWVDERLAEILSGPAADFEAATGIPVALEVHDAAGMVEQAAAALAGGGGPDVFFGSHLDARRLATEGAILSIPIPDPEAYLPEALDAFRSDGGLLGLPFEIWTPALYANTALVTPAAALETDLHGACDVAGVSVRCLALPSDDPVVGLAVVNSFGGYGYAREEDGFDTADVGLGSDGAMAAADYLAAEALAGSFTTSTEAAAAFATGGAVFFVGGPNAAPGPEEWTAVPFHPAGAAGPAVASEARGFMVSAASNQPVAAKVFLTEFAGVDGAMLALFTSDFTVPARVRAFDAARQADPRIAAFAPSGAATVLPWEPSAGGLLEAVRNALSIIAEGAYTEAVPDARAAFAAAAAALAGTG